MRFLRNDRVRQLQMLALQDGGRMRPFADGSPSRTVQWDLARNCASPVTVELHGRKELQRQRHVTVMNDQPDTKPNFLTMEVPCRKCGPCLKRRATMWRLRAIAEYRDAPRTWFSTLTIAPAAAINLLSQARFTLSKSGLDYDALGPEDKFGTLSDLLYRDVQLWLKRLRKNSECPLRYLAIGEEHKSGLPHFHVLLHEMDPDKPLRYDANLKGSWHLGYDQYKLVGDPRAAGYVTKYLTKSVGVRVRASQRYGAGNDVNDGNGGNE